MVTPSLVYSPGFSRQGMHMAARRKTSTAKKQKKKKASVRTKAKPAARPATRRRARQDALALERARLEKNKALVLAFYAKMIGEKDPEAARRFMGNRYVQHSPYAK